MSKKKYVIAGNGVAAAAAIEGIRSTDPDGSITVISAEKHPVYCRPLISYYLEGKTDLERMQYRDPDFYERTGCKVLYGETAEKLLPEEKQLVLGSGKKLAYDELLVAAGSSPLIPPFEGLDSVKNKYSFMTIDDALAIEKAVDRDSRVLIVGAGLIGLKCAEGIAERAGSIIVCDLADRVLSSILDAECAGIVQQHLEEHGIRFMLSDTASRFEDGLAHMKSGADVPFDVLILAVGVRANTGLVKEAGGEVQRGIIVSDRMETSVPDVYAAGDCAQGTDITDGQKKVLALLPNAYLQGYTAGVNMAGGETDFTKGIPMNSIGFFGLHMMTAGTYTGELYEEKTDHSIKKLYTENDLLKGFILLGCEERAGIYTSMIRNQTPVSSVNFELMKKTATTAAFSREERRKKFGGVV